MEWIDTLPCASQTDATILYNQDVEIYDVSKPLGHKNIMTSEIYANVSNTKNNEAVNKISELNLATVKNDTWSVKHLRSKDWIATSNI